MARLRRFSAQIDASAEYFDSDPRVRDAMLEQLGTYVGRDLRGPRGGTYVMGPIQIVREVREGNIVRMVAKMQGKYRRPR